MIFSSGVGRTGAFCLLYAALQELEAGNGIPDLSQLVRKMRQQRKNMLQEKVCVTSTNKPIFEFDCNSVSLLTASVCLD